MERRGLTLIELVMVMVVVAAVVGGLSFYIKDIVDLWNFVSFRNEVASQGRMALSRMIREIRQSNSPTDGYITVADTSSLTFTDIAGNSISYSLSGGNLMRNTEVLAGNTTSLTFTYYDINNAVLSSVPLSSSDRMNVVRINVQLQVSYGGQSLTLQSQTFLRNY